MKYLLYSTSYHTIESKGLQEYCNKLKGNGFKIETIVIEIGRWTETYPIIELNTAEDFNKLLDTVGQYIIETPDDDLRIYQKLGYRPNSIEIYDDDRE